MDNKATFQLVVHSKRYGNSRCSLQNTAKQLSWSGIILFWRLCIPFTLIIYSVFWVVDGTVLMRYGNCLWNILRISTVHLTSLLIFWQPSPRPDSQDQSRPLIPRHPDTRPVKTLGPASPSDSRPVWLLVFLFFIFFLILIEYIFIYGQLII